MELPARALNVLRNTCPEGETIDVWAKRHFTTTESLRELMREPNCGRRSVADIAAWLGIEDKLTPSLRPLPKVKSKLSNGMGDKIAAITEPTLENIASLHAYIARLETMVANHRARARKHRGEIERAEQSNRTWHESNVEYRYANQEWAKANAELETALRNIVHWLVNEGRMSEPVEKGRALLDRIDSNRAK